MKIETIRRRMVNMEVRLARDLATLEKMFPKVDWNDAHVATEAMRNLATAVSHIRSFQAMSDFGIEAEIEAHKYAPVSNGDRAC